MLRRGTWVAVAVAASMGMAATASARTLTDCTYPALASEVAAGGTVVLDCEATIPFDEPLAIPAGTTVRLDASGSSVTFDGRRRTRLFEVSGSLTLVNLRLVNGRVEGADGIRGVAGTEHADDDNGAPGGAGGPGSAGSDAGGGAVLVTQSGRLDVIGGALRSNVAAGGQGGTGGRGGHGAGGETGSRGWGGYCESDTTPGTSPECWDCWYRDPNEPPECRQYVGPIGYDGAPGGAGGNGGSGGSGGAGGAASGGAIRNFGSTRIVGTVLAQNVAQGGRGGTGGPGGVAGAGGPGGDAFLDHDWASQSGGDGATGGTGGPAGVPARGGTGQGGAISGPGTLTVLGARLAANVARGGRPGTAPAPRSGGAGGRAGETWEVLGAHDVTGEPGTPGDGAPGAHGGDAGHALGGAMDLAGGTALLQDMLLERNTALSPGGGTGGEGGASLPGSTPTGAGGNGGTGGDGGDARGGAVFTGGAALRVAGLAFDADEVLVGAQAQGGPGGAGFPAGAPGAPGQVGSAADPDVSGTTTSTSALTISPAPMRERATVGVPYELRLTASGGTAPYTYAVYGLPPGVTLKAPRLIRGTPTRPRARTASTRS